MLPQLLLVIFRSHSVASGDVWEVHAVESNAARASLLTVDKVAIESVVQGDIVLRVENFSDVDFVKGIPPSLCNQECYLLALVSNVIVDSNDCSTRLFVAAPASL